MRTLVVRCLLLVLALSTFSAAEEDLASRVLVVTGSKKVADYYMKKRGIPAENRCSVHAVGELLPFDFYDKDVAQPIRKCLDRLGKDRILYIVLTAGIPYKLVNQPQGFGRAVDSYIADIWEQSSTVPRVMNPYFDSAIPHVGNYAPFISLAEYRARPGAKPVYSVWRLDGPSDSEARALVDKAMEAEKTGLSGRVCLDRRFGEITQIKAPVYGEGDWDLYRAGMQFREAGVPVLEDENDAEFGTPPAPARCDDAIFYAGWYSLNRYYDVFTWKTGAIGFHLDSQSANDIRRGPSWSGEALKRGITVTSGAVDEPTLWGLPHAGGLVHDLLAGANVGDAFLRNTLWLRWMIVNIGDPLYRPRFLPSKTTERPAAENPSVNQSKPETPRPNQHK